MGLESQIGGLNPPWTMSAVGWGEQLWVLRVLTLGVSAAFRGRLHPLMKMFQLVIFKDYFSRQKLSL